MKQITILQNLAVKEGIPELNKKAVSELMSIDLPDELFVIHVYEKDKCFVKNGIFVPISETGLNYANVPLAFIVEGEATVCKDGKDTKKLGAGDFFGLFETADYISTGRSRNIGNWTLKTQSRTKVMFFKEQFFKTAGAEVEKFKNYLVDTARRDPVPQPITALPLLDWVTSHTTKSRLDGYFIIVHTHLLSNNVPLFRHLAHLVGVNRIYVIGKPYSTIRDAHIQLVSAGIEIIPVHQKIGVPYDFAVGESIKILWHKLLENHKENSFSKVLILDDGGDIWTSIPWEKLGDIDIAGTEQTQRGITRIRETKLRLPPIVSVATCGIKKEMESVFIAKAAIKKVLRNYGRKHMTFGILGMGSIGKALYKELADRNEKHVYYDSDNQSELNGKIQSIDELIDVSDVIVGTTGTDALKATPFERLKGKKLLVSVSSSDVEFSSILQFIDTQEGDPFDDIDIKVHHDLSFKILNGGYPINFDRTIDATPDNQIVLTRCLLYIGLMQASLLLENKKSTKSGFYNLDVVSQKNLLKEWFSRYPDISNDFNLDEQLKNIDDYAKSDFNKSSIKLWN